jgi:hypothetical protein
VKGALVGMLAGACSGSPHQAPSPARTEPVAVTVTLVQPPSADPVAVTATNQPPAIKLKLGHYRSASRGIGLVIDRTQHEAKLRFDGTAEILHLDPSPANLGRTDYGRTSHEVLLQVWDDNRIIIYVPGGDGTGLDVLRDGDAEPL